METGHISNGPEGAPGTVPIIGYRPSEDARVLYLAAKLPDAVVPALRPLEPVGNIVPAALSRTADNRAFGIYSAWSGLFLVAAPPATSTEVAHAVLTTAIPQEWEQFLLQDAGENEAPECLRAATALLDQVSAPAPNEISVLSLIERASPGAASRDALNAAGLLLSRVQLNRLAALLTKREDLISKLESLYPNDLAAQHAIRQTAKWLIGRSQPHRQQLPDTASTKEEPKTLPWPGVVRSARPKLPQSAVQSTTAGHSHVGCAGAELDRLDTVGIAGTFVSLPHACNIAMRRSVEPRKRCCVLATARNEGLYIVEWIAHHKALGWEHCFIYSNDNSDGSDELLGRLADAGEITWIQNKVGEGTRPQWKAYNHALQVMPEILDYEWTLVIDLDEYFNLDCAFFDGVGDYLDWCERVSVDAIALNWVVVGSNGETHWRDFPLRQRFPMGNNPRDAARSSSPLVKSLFRTRLFPASMPHHPTPFRGEEFVFRSASMKVYGWHPTTGPGQSIEPDVSTAWISHYFYKSNEEFLLKFHRARGDDKSGSTAEFPALSADFVSGFVRDGSSSRSLAKPHPLEEAFAGTVQRLLQHPGVASAQDDIKRFYATYLGSLAKTAASCRGIIDAGEMGEAFLRPLLVARAENRPQDG